MKIFIQSMNKILQRNKVILISNNVVDFIDYKLELNSYKGINICVFIDFIKFILKVKIVRGENMSIEVEKIKVLLILILLLVR